MDCRCDLKAKLVSIGGQISRATIAAWACSSVSVETNYHVAIILGKPVPVSVLEDCVHPVPCLAVIVSKTAITARVWHIFVQLYCWHIYESPYLTILKLDLLVEEQVRWVPHIVL
jgi:hypothetical protein